MRLSTRWAGLALLPLLAACAGGGEAGRADVPGGSTLQAIRGAPEASDPLRPEPGNIWADGLTPSAPDAAATARPPR
ncbi:hypothetical protein [Pseudoroseomonas cervicalis]|uniref:hypothetical protein n=1 Tax=Teichococcus cervicalis TaxID=204525 RepID=UPI0022F16BD8|nr:hypothetical protein [Pseudoroseomonas cervicalis]WBV44414.1 hypothetical protein PFY06_07595 [Pseudoroseomonas cervicalis]